MSAAIGQAAIGIAGSREGISSARAVRAARPASAPGVGDSTPVASGRGKSDAASGGASLTSTAFGVSFGPFSLKYVSERVDLGATGDAASVSAPAPSTPSSSSSSSAAQAVPGERDAEFSRLLRDMARKRGATTPARSRETARSGVASSFSAGELPREGFAGSGAAPRAMSRGLDAYRAQLAGPGFQRSGAGLSLSV